MDLTFVAPHPINHSRLVAGGFIRVDNRVTVLMRQSRGPGDGGVRINLQPEDVVSMRVRLSE